MTAQERAAWLASLEQEENERLSALVAAAHAFEVEQPPALARVNSLLIAAFQGQVTMMRASRVFHARSSGSCTDITQAMAHDPTAALAHRLYHCWRVLGVTRPTLKALLRQVVYTVGSETRRARAGFFVGLMPDLRRGIDPKAHAAFVAEGSGECGVECYSCSSPHSSRLFLSSLRVS